MKIPCVENRCILLPICKNKETLNCTVLDSYYTDLYKKVYSGSLKQESLVIFSKFFPVLEYLTDETDPLIAWTIKDFSNDSMCKE